ncbi:MAG: HAD family hydrolase [Caldicoprobacterales bacterium]|nr:HAD family phosphatase [Clostridiales bacterium]
MIKAFIFDLDGVIIDSEPLHYEADKIVFREFGIELADGELDGYVGIDTRQMVTELRDKYNIETSVDDLLEKLQCVKLDLLKTWKFEAIDGIRDLISDLKNNNIAIALASSSPMRFIRLAIEKIGISKHFDLIVSGEHVDKSKPEPDIFLRAAHLLEVKPSECLVLEDSVNGVTAAKRAGMKCIGFLNPNSGNQDLSKADKIVTTLERLEYKDLFNNPGKK